MASLPRMDRSRVAWWAVVLALGGTLAFVLHSFVGTFVLGVFAYYGMRPLHRRIESVLGDRRLTALITLFGVLLPFIAVLALVGFKALQEAAAIAGTQFVQDALRTYLDVSTLSGTDTGIVRSLLRNPEEFLGLGSGTVGNVTRVLGALGAGASGLLHVFLALTFAYFLLRDDGGVAGWFRERVGGEGTTAYTYARTVDADLETIYSGNILTVFVVAVLAVVVYNGFNLLAPPALAIPLPTVLAVLTGAASLVPIIVSKIVWVPVTGYVGLRAVRTNTGLGYAVGIAAVSLIALDLTPQMVIRPYLAGRDSHSGMVLFSYVLGTMLFGWYGFFLGPLLMVLMVQAVRLVVPELISGEPVRPDARGAEGLGVDPSELGLDQPDRGGAEDASGAEDAGGAEDASGAEDAGGEGTGKDGTGEEERTGEKETGGGGAGAGGSDA